MSERKVIINGVDCVYDNEFPTEDDTVYVADRQGAGMSETTFSYDGIRGTRKHRTTAKGTTTSTPDRPQASHSPMITEEGSGGTPPEVKSWREYAKLFKPGDEKNLNEMRGAMLKYRREFIRVFNNHPLRTKRLNKLEMTVVFSVGIVVGLVASPMLCLAGVCLWG